MLIRCFVFWCSIFACQNSRMVCWFEKSRLPFRNSPGLSLNNNFCCLFRLSRIDVCSHLNFRFRTCFVQGVPWHSGNYRVWIHSETCTWHDKNMQSVSKRCSASEGLLSKLSVNKILPSFRNGCIRKTGILSVVGISSLPSSL